MIQFSKSHALHCKVGLTKNSEQFQKPTTRGSLVSRGFKTEPGVIYIYILITVGRWVSTLECALATSFVLCPKFNITILALVLQNKEFDGQRVCVHIPLQGLLFHEEWPDSKACKDSCCWSWFCNLAGFALASWKLQRLSNLTCPPWLCKEPHHFLHQTLAIYSPATFCSYNWEKLHKLHHLQRRNQKAQPPHTEKKQIEYKKNAHNCLWSSKVKSSTLGH